jgi:hypothetical protein
MNMAAMKGSIVLRSHYREKRYRDLRLSSKAYG